MPITAQDKKKKIRDSRSRNIFQKINLIKQRDGSDIPPMDSLSDADNFNLSQLFGASMSANINWQQLGVEGLIRAYYSIEYYINGKKRDNIIVNNGELQTTRSDLTSAAKKILAGSAHTSGFFVNNQQEAARGAFDLNSSSFHSNIDNDSYDTPTLIDYINLSIDLIGSKSSLGQKTINWPWGSSRPDWNTYIDDETILGNRFHDVNPYSYVEPYELDEEEQYLNPDYPGTYIDGNGDEQQEPEFLTRTITVQYPGEIRYGNGNYDFENNTSLTQDQTNPASGGSWEWWNPSGNPINETNTLAPGYNYTYRDFYDSNLDSYLLNIKSKLENMITFIEYTMVNDPSNYWMNPDIIPGINDNYSMQQLWLSFLNESVDYINNYINTFSSLSRQGKDVAIIDMKDHLQNLLLSINNVLTIVQSIYGDSSTVSDPSTLYGFRALWIKAILDTGEGSKINLYSLDTAIQNATKSIASTEEGFGLFGVTLENNTGQYSWANRKVWEGGLPTPDIAGIEFHPALDTRQYLDDDETIENPTYLEMIYDGYIVAWAEIQHASGYDLWRSKDYDPATETGTWEKILPVGQNFSFEEVDINTGKVISYYIDTDVDIENEEIVYYKIKAYDRGLAGSDGWLGGTSEICDPKSYLDFISTPSQTTVVPGLTAGAPTLAPTAIDFSDWFKYTTLRMGGESTDNPVNRSYESYIEFDSLGTDLEVFVDGQLRHQGPGDNDYILLDTKNIQFNSPVSSSSRVTLIVYFGRGSGSGSGSWLDPVDTIGQRPTTGLADGDVILVKDENMLYSWDGIESSWYAIAGAGSGDLLHSDLSDMPDDHGINPDHDGRYHTKDQVNNLIQDLENKIQGLNFLIPDDAIPLSAPLSFSSDNYLTGYLSDGTFNRFSTLSPRQRYTKIIVGNNFTFENGNSSDQFSDADKGILELYLNDTLIDSFSLESHFDESQRTTNQTYTPAASPSGYITITSVTPYQNYANHQIGSFNINMTSTILTPGENNIYVKHKFDDQENSSMNLVFFWDSSSQAIIADAIEVDEHDLRSRKYISGIRYYTKGDLINFKFRSFGVFSNTYYIQNQVMLDLQDFGIENIGLNYESPGVTGDWINPAEPFYDSPFYYSYNHFLNKDNVYNISPTFSFYGQRPGYTSQTFELNKDKFLINTYNNFSDEKNEYFVDEQYRLPNSNYDNVPNIITGLWNSERPLDDEELLIFNKSLTYPRENYSIDYEPNQTVNYLSYSGERFYFRAFRDEGRAHSNGKFIINGDILASENIKIMIKLPGQTGWLDILKPYNEADFTGSDGNGILIDQNGNEFYWTLSQYSTIFSGYMIILRVSMNSSVSEVIKQISINW